MRDRTAARLCTPCVKRKVRQTVRGSARPAEADTSYAADTAQRQVPRESQAARATPAAAAESREPRWVAAAEAARAWAQQRQTQDVQAAYWQTPAFQAAFRRTTALGNAPVAGGAEDNRPLQPRPEDNRPRQPRQRATAVATRAATWRTRPRTTCANLPELCRCTREHRVDRGKPKALLVCARGESVIGPSNGCCCSRGRRE